MQVSGGGRDRRAGRGRGERRVWAGRSACCLLPHRPSPYFSPPCVCRGLVMGRLRSQQRQREVQVMQFCFTKLGEGERYGRVLIGWLAL